jgi:hypothetical protein
VGKESLDLEHRDQVSDAREQLRRADHDPGASDDVVDGDPIPGPFADLVTDERDGLGRP